MNELEFHTITKYLGKLKQKIQNEIIDMIQDMDTATTGEKKLE